MSAGINLETYELALAVLKHRLQTVRSSWFPPRVWQQFHATINPRVRCAIMWSVANPAIASVYDDGDLKIKLAVMDLLMEEGHFLYLLAKVFVKGLGLMFTDMAPCIHVSILGISYWSCGMVTFLKDCRFRREATYHIAKMLAFTIQHFEHLILEQGGWDKFLEVQHFFLNAPENPFYNNRYFDNTLKDCFLKMSAGSLRQLPS